MKFPDTSLLWIFMPIIVHKTLAIKQHSFLSNWVPITAPSNNDIDIAHGLGELPIKVDVEVKVQDPTLGEIIFNAMGSAHTGNGNSAEFGGVVYVYNENTVKIMVPNKNGCSGQCKGGIVYLGSAGYVGPSSSAVKFTSGHVRVRAWKVCDFARPSFVSDEIELSDSENYKEVRHGLGRIPDLAIVQAHIDGGWVSDGQGAAHYSQNPYGGVLFGTGKSTVYLWTPSGGSHSSGGVFSSKNWGSGAVASDTRAKVRVFAWKFQDLTHSPIVSEVTLYYKPSNPDKHIELTNALTDDHFLVVKIIPETGTNTEVAFYVGGTATNVADVTSGHYYGGIITSFVGKNLYIWNPSDSDKGCLALVGGNWGNGRRAQCQTIDTRIIISLYVANEDEPPCKELPCSWSAIGPQCDCTGTGFEGQYCENRVPCPSPSGHQNADYSPKQNKYVYENEIVFFCRNGYEFASGDKNSKCSAAKTWTGVSYKCTPVSCGTPQSGTNTQDPFTITGTTYGHTVTYKCMAGYDIKTGNLIRECQADRVWSGLKPACDKSCGEPSAPTGASRRDSGLTLGAIATYVCLTGYEFVSGNMVRQCQNSGDWDGVAPVCKKVSCGSPGAGTKSSFPSTPGLFGDIVTYTCNSGYEKDVDGNTMLSTTCKADKTWSESPLVCYKITCVNITATPPNSRMVSYTGNRFGDQAVYECNIGTTIMSGNLQRECTADRSWSGNEPNCGAVVCPLLSNPENGVTYLFGNKYGDLAVSVCNNPDFSLKSGDIVRNCTSTGQWAGTPAVCAAAYTVWARNESSSRIPDIKSLIIPWKNTSRYHRTLISASDSRVSSLGIGVVGTVILVGVLLGLITIDIDNYQRYREKMAAKKAANQSGTATSGANSNSGKGAGKNDKQHKEA